MGRGARIVVVMCVLCAAACESRTTHKWLNVFFDGVPEYQKWMEGDQDGKNGEERDPKEQPDGKKRAVVENHGHKPYTTGQCGDCHDFKGGNRLVVPLTDLCLMCHDEQKPRAGGFAHGPVAAGLCTECHNPHESRNPRMLTMPAKEICRDCHGSMKRGELVHEPVRTGTCGDCHDMAHKKGLSALLADEPKKLCRNCHDDKFAYKFMHEPAAGGDCLACHATHGEGKFHLLSSNEEVVCGTCHDVKDLQKDSHKNRKGTSCYSCHNPHGGENKSFLVGGKKG